MLARRGEIEVFDSSSLLSGVSHGGPSPDEGASSRRGVADPPRVCLGQRFVGESVNGAVEIREDRALLKTFPGVGNATGSRSFPVLLPPSTIPVTAASVDPIGAASRAASTGSMSPIVAELLSVEAAVAELERGLSWSDRLSDRECVDEAARTMKKLGTPEDVAAQKRLLESLQEKLDGFLSLAVKSKRQCDQLVISDGAEVERASSALGRFRDAAPLAALLRTDVRRLLDVSADWTGADGSRFADGESGSEAGKAADTGALDAIEKEVEELERLACACEGEVDNATAECQRQLEEFSLTVLGPMFGASA